MDRLQYAAERRDTYLEWCTAVAAGPASDLDRMEFALISAHCPFDRAVAGWYATRGVDDLEELVLMLEETSVLFARNKAANICYLRDEPRFLAPPYKELRRTLKLPGLGYCKFSFAMCLIDPLRSDVVCLDTHMLQAMLGYKPGVNETQRFYQNLKRYEGLEATVLQEAASLDMPPFAFQWSVWDHQRGYATNHSFLWR